MRWWPRRELANQKVRNSGVTLRDSSYQSCGVFQLRKLNNYLHLFTLASLNFPTPPNICSSKYFMSQHLFRGNQIFRIFNILAFEQVKLVKVNVSVVVSLYLSRGHHPIIIISNRLLFSSLLSALSCPARQYGGSQLACFLGWISSGLLWWELYYAQLTSFQEFNSTGEALSWLVLVLAGLRRINHKPQRSCSAGMWAVNMEPVK